MKRRRKPESVGDAVAGWLDRSGLASRVAQAGIVPEWASLVGGQIATVTVPQSITADGTLFVAVTTNAWMTELSLMEPELLKALNRRPGSAPIRKIRWQIQR